MHPHCRISKRWHVVDVNNFTGDDQTTLTVDRNSAIQVCLRLHYSNWCSAGGSAADGSFRRSLKQHVTDVKNIAGLTLIDRNSANTTIYAYEIKQNVSKNLFLLLRTPLRLMALRSIFFFCYHWQWLLFTHLKNNFSTTFDDLDLTEKPRYTYCRIFFVVSIYIKTIDIIKKNFCFLFLYTIHYV